MWSLTQARGTRTGKFVYSSRTLTHNEPILITFVTVNVFNTLFLYNKSTAFLNKQNIGVMYLELNFYYLIPPPHPTPTL
jgi:hypothetical protein